MNKTAYMLGYQHNRNLHKKAYMEAYTLNKEAGATWDYVKNFSGRAAHNLWKDKWHPSSWGYDISNASDAAGMDTALNMASGFAKKYAPALIGGAAIIGGMMMGGGSKDNKGVTTYAGPTSFTPPQRQGDYKTYNPNAFKENTGLQPYA